MLECSPRDVGIRMALAGARVAIIGRNQLTTDIPEHSFLKWSEGGCVGGGGASLEGLGIGRRRGVVAYAVLSLPLMLMMG